VSGEFVRTESSVQRFGVGTPEHDRLTLLAERFSIGFCVERESDAKEAGLFQEARRKYSVRRAGILQPAAPFRSAEPGMDWQNRFPREGAQDSERKPD